MKIKELLFFAMVGTLWASFADTPTITSIAAQQRYPWNGKVDITVTFTGSSNEVARMDCIFAATNSATQAALAVNHVTAVEGAQGEGTTWTRHFIWDAAADVGPVKIDDVALTVVAAAGIGGVQLWENGPYWAECNVGATKPEEYGYYFWWGDTVGYTRNANNDGWVSVKSGAAFEFYDSTCLTWGKGKADLQSAGYIDSTGNLVAAHDAATAHLGAPWRMPTDAESQALIDNCTTTWTTRNGVSGRLVTGKGAYASKSIFLPAAGNGNDSYLYCLGSYGLYWSSTTTSGNSFNAWGLYFHSGDFFRGDDERDLGQSVRPLRVSGGTTANGMTTHFAYDGIPDSSTESSIEVTSVVAQQRYPWNGKVDIAVSFTGTSNRVARMDCTFAATNSATRAALAVDHVTAVEGARGAGTTWTRHFIWDAAADVGPVKIDDVALTVTADLGGVQLWENGPYWAECNVGASQPEESGYYFWCGDAVGYTRNANNDGWVSVKDGTSFSFSDDNCPTSGKDNSALQSAGYIDSTGNLVAAHDAATAYLGAPWRMPTSAEIDALIINCTTTWTTRNGVYGRLVTGKGAYASKSIFLPAAGYGYYSFLNKLGSYGCFWSSTPNSDYSGGAWYLYFNSGAFGRRDSDRCSGQSVRPLRGFADPGASSLCASTHLALDATSGTRTAAATETIRYSSAWESTDSGATAVVTVNGEVIHSSTGAGSVDWSPTRNGTYTLTHKVMNGEAQVGETLSATFAVAGIYPAAVTISPASSEFEGELKVTLSCATKDATIRYTTDGSEPTMASAAYVEALTLTCTTTVKARAFFENGDASPDTATAIYTLKDPAASDFVVADGVLTKYTGVGGAVAIPDGVTSIGDNAFDGCSSLISVKIPGSVTNISEWAFGDCNSLMSVTIPDSVRSIGDYAFFGCSGLTSVAILNRVTSIGNYAFRGCSSLRKAYIPQSLKGAFEEGKVFYNCSSDLEIVYYKPISGIAEDADEESVMAAVEGVGFADAAVKAVIGGSVAQYKAFKSWAGSVAGGEAAVVTSPYAAASYLLGATALFENKPKVEIATIAVGESGGGEQGQAINVEVVVKDGESAVAVAAEKVAQMFEATSDLGDWNGAAKLAPTVTVSGTDSNGKMSFTVKPGDGKTSQAFLRIRK